MYLTKNNQMLVSLIDDTYISSNDAITITDASSKTGKKFIVTNHHAGNYIPKYLLPNIIVNKNELVNDSDKDTDKLYLAADIGGTSIVSKINRNIVDLNRARDHKGESGVMRTKTFNGNFIYSLHYAMPLNEKEKLLQNYWDPFHTAIVSEISNLIRLHEKAIIFMGDSMNNLSPKFSYGEYETGKEKRPDIAVITRGDLSADINLINTFFDALRSYANEAGLNNIKKNNPWTGGSNDFILQNYGKPDKNRHVIQIETNKRLISSDADIETLNAMIKRAMNDTVRLHLDK